MAYMSAGEREVMALSILTAFPILTGGSLILDSPFPHLDSSKRQKLLKHLPEISKRVYLSLPEGSLTPGEEKELLGRFASNNGKVKRYRLIRRDKGTTLEMMEGGAK